MEGHSVMSAKERRPKVELEGVREGRQSIKEAAMRLWGMSYRHCRRSYERFRVQGGKGLVHRRRGRPSNREKPQVERLSALLIRGHKPKVVGTLMPGMIHELNNPLNNIMLIAGVLQEDFPDLSEEDRLEMIDGLVRESERAQAIARKYMEFVGESEYNCQPHEVREIIEGALQLASNTIKRAKVKVKGELATDPPQISCDRHQLEQVFLDIILNAVEAMPDGGTLSISSKSAAADAVLIEFTDTGVGVPEESARLIFEPFFTTKPALESDGLGLFLAKEAIKKLGGDIRLQSREGDGATFVVQLPASNTSAHTPDG